MVAGGRVEGGWRAGEGCGLAHLAELDECGAEAEEAITDELRRRRLGGTQVLALLVHALLGLARLARLSRQGQG